MTPSFAAYQKYAEALRLRYEEGESPVTLLWEVVALDPDFAAAWYFLGSDLMNFQQRDSGLAAIAEARKRPHRLTRWDRLMVEAAAVPPGHLDEALQIRIQALRELPNDWRSWNNYGTVLYRLRGPEAYLAVLDSAARLEKFSTHIAAFNRTLALIVAGRRVEARQVAQRMRNERQRLGLLVHAAVLDGEWNEVDSLGPLLELAYLTELGRAATGLHWRRTRHLVRGEVQAARETAESSPGSKLSLLWELATSAPVSQVDTGWEGAFEAALAGDTLAARGSLAGLTADTLDYRVQSRYWPAAVEAAIAAQRGDWNGVARLTGPLVRDRPALSSTIGPGVRWLTAHAYERLDRLDSAVVLLGELVEPGHLDAPSLNSFPYGAANSYLRQHLIVLLARLGRVDEARRHWEIFRVSFTNPDPEYAGLIDEARSALEVAEAKARGR